MSDQIDKNLTTERERERERVRIPSYGSLSKDSKHCK